jgi:GH24 family phage-related lysozyme (muramidase)
MDQKAILRQFLKWEHKVSFMYLDTKNHVTVGIGHLLKNVEAAQALPFVYRADHQKTKDFPGAQKGQAATTDEIKDNYNKVMKRASKKGHKQNLSYKAFEDSELELTEKQILKIFYADVATAEHDLGVLFPKIDSYPIEAQMALMDMVYNMGRGLLKGRKLLVEAVKARDWEKAATKTSAYCYRNWVKTKKGDKRNEDTAALFRAAAVAEKQKKAKDPETPKGRPRNVSSPFQPTPSGGLTTPLVRQRSVPPR